MQDRHRLKPLRKPHPDVTQARIAVDGIAALVQTLAEENQLLKEEAVRLRGLKLRAPGSEDTVVRTRFHGSPQMEQPNHRSAVDHGHAGAWQLYLDADAPPGTHGVEGTEAEAIAWCLHGTIPVRP